jgi:hypothetical protein
MKSDRAGNESGKIRWLSDSDLQVHVGKLKFCH